MYLCDVVKDTGKEQCLRPFIHIGLVYFKNSINQYRQYFNSNHRTMALGTPVLAAPPPPATKKCRSPTIRKVYNGKSVEAKVTPFAAIFVSDVADVRKHCDVRLCWAVCSGCSQTQRTSGKQRSHLRCVKFLRNARGLWTFRSRERNDHTVSCLYGRRGNG